MFAARNKFTAPKIKKNNLNIDYMEKKIILKDQKAREEIAQAFNCGLPAVSLALSYQRNSPTSEKIRQMALAKGGEVWAKTDAQAKPIKELDSKGNVKRVIEKV